jgi:predicted ABC-type sugar transport system permease subunit
MAARRPVLAPGVLAGIPMAMGGYALFGGVGAIIGSLPAAALATIVLGMTIATRRA